MQIDLCRGWGGCRQPGVWLLEEIDRVFPHDVSGDREGHVKWDVRILVDHEQYSWIIIHVLTIFLFEAQIR
jgi:hypothetical protein